jgi:hypothetical protein
MQSFFRHLVHARRLQTLYLIHKSHGIVAMIVGKNENDVHGLLLAEARHYKPEGQDGSNHSPEKSAES